MPNEDGKGRTPVGVFSSVLGSAPKFLTLSFPFRLINNVKASLNELQGVLSSLS